MDTDTEMLRLIALANAETVNNLASILGMHAENKQREIEGKSMAYVEHHFTAASNLNYINTLLDKNIK